MRTDKVWRDGSASASDDLVNMNRRTSAVRHLPSARKWLVLAEKGPMLDRRDPARDGSRLPR